MIDILDESSIYLSPNEMRFITSNNVRERKSLIFPGNKK